MVKNNLAIDPSACNALAEKLFLNRSGFGQESEEFDRMKKDAYVIRQMIQGQIKPFASICFFEKKEFSLVEERLQVGDKEFSCPAFAQVSEDSLEGLYFYVCCVGDYFVPEKNMSAQLYADFWGTAFVDAVRMQVREQLSAKGQLSDSFGPGFYGMPVESVLPMKDFLNYEQLGIEVRSTGILIPEKSCTGIYFRVNDRYKMLNQQCRSCFGNKTSCRLCQLNHDDDTRVKNI